jgi:hypothetical protein
MWGRAGLERTPYLSWKVRARSIGLFCQIHPDLGRDAAIVSTVVLASRISRTWDAALPRACWNCLNPSTADANVNDPPLIRMMRFSRSLGFDGCDLVNI